MSCCGCGAGKAASPLLWLCLWWSLFFSPLQQTQRVGGGSLRKLVVVDLICVCRSPQLIWNLSFFFVTAFKQTHRKCEIPSFAYPLSCRSSVVRDFPVSTVSDLSISLRAFWIVSLLLTLASQRESGAVSAEVRADGGVVTGVMAPGDRIQDEGREFRRLLRQLQTSTRALTAKVITLRRVRCHRTSGSDL